jgi:hypothetical protein
VDHKWFSSLPKAEQEDRKKFVYANQKLLDILSKIVYNMGIVESRPHSEADYDSPSWAYKQADRNGYLRAYSEILALLNVSDKDHQ